MSGRKALLFINGEPPDDLPDLTSYSLIACSDGAFHYLKRMKFPLAKLDFISGDFDSHHGSDEEIYREKFIFTPDQDFTDFEKSLQLLFDLGITEVDVYGASGGEQDHYLGNLHAAFVYRDKLRITFFDQYSSYFFIAQNFRAEDMKGKMVSLVPFPEAKNIITKGLKWNLQEENLSLHTRIGTRNVAVSENIEIGFESGSLLVFIHNK